MRVYKRLFAILMVVFMLITYIPGLAYAAEEKKDIASGTCGTCEWILDSDGVLTISEGAMDDWGDYPPWYEYCSEIKKVKTTGRVKMATCSHMFYASDVSSIDISNLDTSNVTDMNGMFFECKQLTGLDVSNFDTTNVTSMRDMFYYCEKLTSLDVSNFDTSNVTDMNGMFDFCSSLTSLDVRNFDTRNVTDMGCMFASCSSLTSLDVRNFDTKNVTYMGGMFSECKKLTSLDVSNFDTRNVTEMWGMFSTCSKLTSLDVSNFDTRNVTNMSGMFSGCSCSLDVSNFDTSNVTDMAYMFMDCEELTSLDVSNFDTSNVTDMCGMFWNCSSLTSLDVSNFDTSNVTDMRCMFDNCSSLTSLDLSNFDFINVRSLLSAFSMYNIKVLKIGKNFYSVGSDLQPTFPIPMYDKETGQLYSAGQIIPAVDYKTYVSDMSVDPQDPTEHTYGDWRETKAATCTETGTREKTCSHCGDVITENIPALGHSWSAWAVTKKATTNEDGVETRTCKRCNATEERSIPATVAKPTTFKLSNAKFVYDGKVKKPTVTVTDANGSNLELGTDYTVTYQGGCKNVGKYSATVKLIGAYSGSKTLPFTIYPKPTTLSKVIAGPKGLIANWKKMTPQTTGYVIQYSTDSKFKSGCKEVRITSNKTLSKVIIRLKAKKKYYIRIKTYKHFDGYNLYSTWSKAKAVTTKDFTPRTQLKGLDSGCKKRAVDLLDVGLPNCTTYALARALEIKDYNYKKNPNYTPPFIKPGHSNAVHWWNNNKKAKKPFPTGKEPMLGAIAVWSNGGAGHVAVVEGINSKGVVYYSHSNYGSRDARGFSWTPGLKYPGSVNDVNFHCEAKYRANGKQIWGFNEKLLGYIYVN